MPCAAIDRAAARVATSSSGCSSRPSGPMRPPTSKMCSGGTGRFGFTQANRLARRGTSCRPISSTYLKPAVVMSAAGAPLPSRIRLVATVVPCRTREMSALEKPEIFSTSARPLPKPREGSSGVDGVLADHTRPVAGSSSVTSVNVPPVSMPTIRRAAGCFGCAAITRARRGSRDGGRAWAAAGGRAAWPSQPGQRTCRRRPE